MHAEAGILFDSGVCSKMYQVHTLTGQAFLLLLAGAVPSNAGAAPVLGAVCNSMQVNANEPKAGARRWDQQPFEREDTQVAIVAGLQ